MDVTSFVFLITAGSDAEHPEPIDDGHFAVAQSAPRRAAIGRGAAPIAAPLPASRGQAPPTAGQSAGDPAFLVPDWPAAIMFFEFDQ